MFKILVQVTFNSCSILDACLKFLKCTHWNDFFIQFYEGKTYILLWISIWIYLICSKAMLSDSESEFAALG